MLSLFFVASAAIATPPKVEVKPALGDALIGGCRQTLVVTLTNPAEGDALNGEVQVSLEDGRSGVADQTYARRVALPRGGGTAQASVTVFVPAGTPPDVVVTVLNTTSGSGGGDVVTQQRFDGLAGRAESLAVLAVASSDPSPLAALSGVELGVYQSDGALRPAAPPGSKGSINRPYLNGQAATGKGATPARIVPVAEPALLPDRAAGYAMIGAVYLGDAPPAAFTDAQISALRGYARGGGLIVSGAASRLRRDTRFRALLPEPAPPFTWLPMGRGAVVSLPALPSDGPAQRTLWTQLLQRAALPAGIGRQVENSADWTSFAFGRSVVHAPGLRPPTPAVVAAFLVGYMVLLLPANFLLLRRLRHPEWAWATIPAVVLVASFGAYRVGVAVKGGDTLLNVASVVEMGAGSGSATVTSSIGLFSPSRRTYDIAVPVADALLSPPETPSGRYRRGRRPGGGSGQTPEPPPVIDLDASGVTARAVSVPQWAMRTLRARSDTLTLGGGLVTHLAMQGNRITGSLENRTGRELWDVVIYGNGGRQRIDRLQAGESKPVSFIEDDQDAGRGRAWETPLGRFAVPPAGARADSSEAVRTRLNAVITEDISRAVGPLLAGQRVEDVADRRRAGLPPREAVTVAAWNTDPLLPVTVDGHPVSRGAHVNLILVSAPVNSPGDAASSAPH